MKKRIRRTFTKQFKIEAVKQVADSNKSLAQVAGDLGIHDKLLRGWCKDVENIKSLPNTEESKDEKIWRLRAELESMKEDNEILKKATAYFAKMQR